VPTDGPFAR